MGRVTLLNRVRERVARSKEDVFLLRDFADLGGRAQVHRALRALVAAGELGRIGYGLYARTEVYQGEILLAVRGGFDQASKTALDRLGVRWSPGWWETEYNEGRTDQIPVNAVVRLHSRFRRHIVWKGRELTIER